MSVPWCERPPERGAPHESLNADPGAGQVSPPTTRPLPLPLAGPGRLGAACDCRRAAAAATSAARRAAEERVELLLLGLHLLERLELARPRVRERGPLYVEVLRDGAQLTGSGVVACVHTVQVLGPPGEVARLLVLEHGEVVCARPGVGLQGTTRDRGT
jgi:hypothetical protein